MRNHIDQPKVTLVGAGPGHPDLITIAGLKAIERADIILYDALVHPDLLKYAPSSCHVVFVGKRNRIKQYEQSEINELLYDYAMCHSNVIRLKGGDPYIFGRGSEETSFLESKGVATEVIPGLSSVTSVPASQGIPLTRRGVSESFWVITGTTSDGSISKDIEHAAPSTATMVVLMGLHQIKKILKCISQYRNPLTPVAVIQNGTLEGEIIQTDVLSNYIELSEKVTLGLPGIIVIGDVVSEHNAFLDEQIQRVLQEF